jgi:hypothetical protein
MAARKKQEEKLPTPEKPAEVKPSAPVEVAQPAVTSATVAPEVIEIIEVVREPAVQEARVEAVTTTEAQPSADPLSDFKDKVNEELDMPDIPKRKNYMWPILLIFIIAIVLLVGIFVYRQGLLKKVTVNITPAATPTPTVTVEPTPAVVDLTKYEVEILNGSEVTGEAAKQKDNLETAGFTVSSVGNADNSDYTDTIIKAKADVDSAFIAKLKSVLNDTFTVGPVQSLSSDAAVPVQVILGTQK